MESFHRNKGYKSFETICEALWLDLSFIFNANLQGYVLKFGDFDEEGFYIKHLIDQWNFF